MTPPAVAARSASGRAVRVPRREEAPKRPALRVLERGSRRGTRALRVVSLGLIAASLLVVVVGHSMLAQGQVRLTAGQAEMAAEQAVHRQLLAAVAAAEDPATIVSEAKNLNLVPPTSIKQVPAVSLDSPVNSGSTQSSTSSTSSTVSSATSTPTTTGSTSSR